ncbi:MAG: acetylglutamate kinase [Rikenellaceae bacterium]|nr:acetylglutamate kinase [Rikenellaceae bacterium]
MLKIFKIGGNVVDNPEKLDKFLTDFSTIEGKKILVHGGGKIATPVSKALGIETTMINGRRVTDGETLKVVTMVYAGLINKTIVSKLQKLGTNSIGLCGADGKFIVSRKRSAEPVDYGFVGDPDVDKFGVDTAQRLIDNGFNIVVAPITYSEEGDLLNTNADTVAQTIALGMSKIYDTELIYCFEKPGVLMDVDDDSSVIKSITPEYFEQLKTDSVVADGMLPKIENAIRAVRGGVKSVVICSSDCIKREGYGGTVITE